VKKMKNLITITDKDITGIENVSTAKPRIAVGVVLFDSENKVALSLIGNWGIHMLPGGGVNRGEDYARAAMREVWEETGCRCEIICELGKTYENRGKDNWTQEKYHFMAKVIGEKGNLHLEDCEFASSTTVCWYPLEEALRIILEQRNDEFYRWEFLKRRDAAVLREAMRIRNEMSK
jgi:8-oxo-dGTP pyrophosphatase MutT (NUDIX family)